MARGIGATRGSTDNDIIQSGYTGYTTTQSWLLWANRNGEGESSFGIMMSHNAQIGISNNQGNVVNTYHFFHGRSTTTGAWRWTRPAANVWGPIVVVYDNALTTNDPSVFTGPTTKLTIGSGVTEYSTPAGTATSTSGAALYLGNRSDLARCWNGDLAWFAKWDVLLNDDEAYALCAGVNPLKVRPASLAECHPLWGLHSSEISLKGNTAATVTGTARQNPPPVQPYTRNWQAFFDIAAAGGLFVNPAGVGGGLAGRRGRLAA